MTDRRRCVVLTGASRGLGLAMAHALMAQAADLRLLCLSRQGVAPPAAAGALVDAWAVDLAEPAPVAQRLHDWLAALDPATVASATLINNAGVLAPAVPLAECPADDLSRALRVGLEAPMALTAAFLRATGAWVDSGWRGPRRVLNVSSGLGRRAMAAQAPYAAAKAGLDHFTRCAALDEAARPHGARLVSLAPGVIDTDMQVQLRAGDPRRFPDHARFVQLQTQGLLTTPETAARQVLAWLDRPDFGQEPVTDVRDA